MSNISVIEKSRGRFFGIKTKSGEKINARYLGSSPKYITVYDRNSGETRKLAKTSVSSVSYSGVEYH